MPTSPEHITYMQRFRKEQRAIGVRRVSVTLTAAEYSRLIASAKGFKESPTTHLKRSALSGLAGEVRLDPDIQTRLDAFLSVVRGIGNNLRAHKDRADRQALIDKLSAKLGKAQRQTTDPATGEIKTAKGKANAKKLITNSGYLKYLEQADQGGVFVLDEDKLDNDAAWDGLHAIVTSDKTSTAKELLARYRRLWMIEDSFRLLKHNLGVRPIYHFKPERIKAHMGICFLAFALLRQAQQRIKLAQKAMSTEHIRNALHSVQASILEHKKTKVKYRLPSAFSQDATRIYKAFNLKRNLDASVLLD